MRRAVVALLILSGLAYLALPASCQNRSEGRRNPEREYDRLSRRAVARDGFPVLDSPCMTPATEVGGALRDNEPVVGVSIGKEHKAYPLSVMGSHELVNDTCGGKPIAISW